jgi:hypothetical protein
MKGRGCGSLCNSTVHRRSCGGRGSWVSSAGDLVMVVVISSEWWETPFHKHGTSKWFLFAVVEEFPKLFRGLSMLILCTTRAYFPNICPTLVTFGELYGSFTMLFGVLLLCSYVPSFFVGLHCYWITRTLRTRVKSLNGSMVGRYDNKLIIIKSDMSLSKKKAPQDLMFPPDVPH